MQRRENRTARWWVPVMAGTAVLSAMLAACGGGGEPALSNTAQQGKQVAINKGCATCHIFYGRDAAGPTWKGVYGSEVTLVDGTTVVADEAYLTQAIKDPWSQKVEGFGTIMPRNSLSDDEVGLVVAYIKELNPDAAGDATTGS